MFYIIEKEDQIPKIPEFDSCFVHIIPNNNYYHPAIAEVSLVYVKPPNSKGYIFCINHSESLNLRWQSIRKFLSEKELYAVDAKYSRYFLNGKIQDLTLNSISHGNGRFDFSNCESRVFLNFYRQYGYMKNTNEIIPITKHYEYCEGMYNIIKPFIYKNSDYEQNLIDVFFKIEKEGIKVDKTCFIRYHENQVNPQFFIKKGIIYTQYNLYTTTGRPSNSFNGINFAALNKDNGERMCFVPKNNYFLECDFSGYHPHLLAKLVGYNFDPNISIYKQIGDIMGIEDISKVKEITFQNIYGGIRKNLHDKPFFKEIHNFTYNLWKEIQHEGYVIASSGKYFRLREIEDPTPQKLLNYYIQNLETSENVEQFSATFNNFRPLKSRIVLYTYDSILIDVMDEERPKIKEIIDSFKYPIHIKIGPNLNELHYE